MIGIRLLHINTLWLLAMPESYVIKGNERAAFCGKTGSGKTFAMKVLSAKLPRLIALDPKGTLTKDKGWDLELWSGKARSNLMQGKPGRYRFVANRENDWTEPLNVAYEVGDIVVIIDEMYPIAEHMPSVRAVRMLYTRGRELGIGTWGATQRPRQIPLFMFSEAEWAMIFRLNDEDDRIRIARALGFPELEHPIPRRDKHGFWLVNDSWDTAKLKRGIVVKQPKKIAKAS